MFHSAKRKDMTSMSYSDFHRLRLRGEMEWLGSYGAMMNHVRNGHVEEA